MVRLTQSLSFIFCGFCFYLQKPANKRLFFAAFTIFNFFFFKQPSIFVNRLQIPADVDVHLGTLVFHVSLAVFCKCL